MKHFVLFYCCFGIEYIQYSLGAKPDCKGRVMDSKLKEPLMGVSILEIGTSNGTVTDLDGNFTLSVPKGVVLRISYVGYLVQEVPINGKHIWIYFEGRY